PCILYKCLVWASCLSCDGKFRITNEMQLDPVGLLLIHEINMDCITEHHLQIGEAVALLADATSGGIIPTSQIAARFFAGCEVEANFQASD
ncbi:MAG: hypothetical protein WCH40_06145, partial [Verrucomicrobiales bacterium]